MTEVALSRSPISDELLYEIKGGIGWITLNRPKILNALSLNIIRRLAQLLKEWEDLSSVKTVVIAGSGEKAFCAGGDVRAVYDAKMAGDFETCDAFFREEYTLNAYIHQYKKPYLALINGIAMGGGLGVSVNGSYRVVTERALLAMPETGIGFFPDVGATTFLSDVPGVVGLYLGLTGTRLTAADALWAGLATHFMPSSSLPDFKTTLQGGMSLEEIFLIYSEPPKEKGFLELHDEAIEAHFHQSSLKDIVESLANDPSPFAKNTYNALRSKSPTSLAVVFRQLREEAPHLSFVERMKLEFRLSQHFIKNHDFVEGVRAVLVDKDQLPHWNPATIEGLTAEYIDSYFSPLGEKELIL